MGDAVRLEEDDVGGGLHVAQEEALLDLVHLGHPAAAGTPAHLPPVQGPCIEKRNEAAVTPSNFYVGNMSLHVRVA